MTTLALASPGQPTVDTSRRTITGLAVPYGPVGQTLARLLRDNRIEPVIIELNVETVRRLVGEGTAAIYGDASHRETLASADVAHAVALVARGHVQLRDLE